MGYGAIVPVVSVAGPSRADQQLGQLFYTSGGRVDQLSSTI